MNKKNNVDKCLLLLVLLLFSCRTSSYLERKNLSFIYSPDPLRINTKIRVHHVSTDTSALLISIPGEELLSKTTGNGTEAKVKLFLVLSEAGGRSIDSSNYDFVIRNKATLDTSLRFFCPAGKKYQLEISLFDLNRGRITRFLTETDKLDNFSRGWVLFRKNGSVLSDDYALQGDTLQVQAPAGLPLTVHYYNRSYFPALPPFTEAKAEPFDTRADSVYPLGSGNKLHLPFKGIYQLFYQDKPVAGVFVFDEGYPKLIKPESLIFPLRYLTSIQEFDELNTSPDKKDLIDNFWLGAAANNKERARVLIRRFYEQVQESNVFFTSYKEGWKTDRGMIYLLFGQPAAVYREGDTEKWVYTGDGVENSYSFVFIHTDHIFTANDYILERSPVYRILWYERVEDWREGRMAKP